jgi:hypothetical protein
VTFGEATTYVLDRLQIPSSDTAKITQTKAILNQETYRLNAEMEYALASAAVTITGGTGLATLPADIQRIKWIDQTTVTILITDEYAFAKRRAQIAAGTASSISNPPTVAVWRPPSTLATLPIPTANVTATLIYVQRPAPMTSDATVLPIPLEAHDYIAEAAVRRMALTEGESAIAQISLDIMGELRGRLQAIRNLQAPQANWQIAMSGYPS